MNLKYLGIALLCIIFTFLAAVAALSQEGDGLSWDDGIADIFAASCTSCHGAAALGGVDLTTYQAAMDSGSIVAGDPDGSSLITTMEAGGHPGMLSDDDLALVREWIAGGALAEAGAVTEEAPEEEIVDEPEPEEPVVEEEVVEPEPQEPEEVEEEVVEEETAVEEEPAEEKEADESVAAPEMTYLDDLGGSEGRLTLAVNADGLDESAPFYQRYDDTYGEQQFFVDELHYRGSIMGDSFVHFRALDSWDESWNASFNLWNPNDFSLWASGVDYGIHEIPSTNRSDRTDSKIGFSFNLGDSNSCTVNYKSQEKSTRFLDTTSTISGWDSNDLDVSCKLNVANLDTTVGFQHRKFNDKSGDTNDLTHTTGIFRAGKQLTDDTYVEGNLLYNISDVALGDDMKTVRFGGYGRFHNVLGQDGFNATARFSWENRDEGPSIFHPAGDGFNAKLDGRWRIDPQFRLRGSWDMSKSKVSRADQYTMFNFRDDPDPTSVNNTYFLDEHYNILTDTVTTNRWNIGGLWKAADALDISADMTWIDRGGLPETDVVYALSPALRWDSESCNVYTVRYNPGLGVGIDNGMWLLKYKTESRNNNDRDSNSDVEHLTINWNGMITDNIFIYLGGGALKTGNSYPTSASFSQNGNEYGGGCNLQWDEKINVFLDYWKYDVGGDWGYDQTSLAAGVKYEINADWVSSFEYENIEGDFTARDDLDFDLSNLFLKISYRWKGY